MSTDVLEKPTATQQASSSDTIQTINPSTGKPLNSYKMMTDQEASEAVKATHQAFLTWKTFSLEKRAEFINKIGEIDDPGNGETYQSGRTRGRFMCGNL